MSLGRVIFPVLKENNWNKKGNHTTDFIREHIEICYVLFFFLLLTRNHFCVLVWKGKIAKSHLQWWRLLAIQNSQSQLKQWEAMWSGTHLVTYKHIHLDDYRVKGREKRHENVDWNGCRPLCPCSPLDPSCPQTVGLHSGWTESLPRDCCLIPVNTSESVARHKGGFSWNIHK